MGKGRDRRRRVRKSRVKMKTHQQIMALLVERSHKWTAVRQLSIAVGVPDAIIRELLKAPVECGDVAVEDCAKWEGGQQYRVLPGLWPSDAILRDLIIAGASELGIREIPVVLLAKRVSQRILGFEAPIAVVKVIRAMIFERELTVTFEPDHNTNVWLDMQANRGYVTVPVDQWLKRTAKEQARAGMV